MFSAMQKALHWRPGGLGSAKHANLAKSLHSSEPRFLSLKMWELGLIRHKVTSCSKFLFRTQNGKNTVMVFYVSTWLVYSPYLIKY